MATLALKPTLRLPHRARSKDDRRPLPEVRLLQDAKPSPWRIIAVTSGVIALTLFALVVPMIGNPAARLFALDATATIATPDPLDSEILLERAFEMTPTMLGPVITDEMVEETEGDWIADEDVTVVFMPQIEIFARPPVSAESTSPRG
jgi:hypothetical protein